ncbi:hypothetical protein PRIPAC_83435 [Pristionchus pacificus]|uniref:Uncharacterized protein n=1 Tax=Pristionchus pacificus TaxID=54126 RepID=A0A2A6CC76_PRIPA|nr:hypothetical protein PRIPAC_83435 [Pristionchus pacificus]|eukprot:PDM75716.1 hypothetical protein PRIPAC_40095 [Pristionchus pacificus]
MSAFLKELEALNAPVAEIPDLEDYNFDNKVKAKSSRRADDSDAEPEHDEVVLQRRRITGAVELHDPRYRGEKVSRADMFGDSSEMRGLRAKKRGMDSDEDDEEDDDGSEEGDDDDEEEEESDDDDIRLDELNGEGEEENDDGSDVEEDEDDEKEGRGEEEGKISMKDLLKPIAEDEERKKGESVRKQMDMCEQILLLNIKSHGAMRAFNQLPRGELAKGLMAGTDEKTRANVNEAHKNALKLVAVLLEAERVLLGGSSQTKDLLKERKEDEKEKAAADSDDEEIESSEDEDEDEKGGKAKKGGKKSKKDAAVDEDEEDFDDDDDDGSIPDYNVEGTDDSEEEDDEEEGGEKQNGGKVESLRGLRKQCIAAEVRYEQFRSTTLQKWDGRTRLAAVGGAAAAAAKQKKADFSAFEGDVLQQIDKILSDKRRLIARTQSKRSDHERIGGVVESTHDTEIFDDDDFYQVLLRDLIERKQAVDTNDPIAMSRQWLEIEKLRQKRKKRNVDTRASKGRKLRYTVIPKLVNFWAATPEYVSWPHEKRNELFHSLFK